MNKKTSLEIFFQFLLKFKIIITTKENGIRSKRFKFTILRKFKANIIIEIKNPKIEKNKNAALADTISPICSVLSVDLKTAEQEIHDANRVTLFLKKNSIYKYTYNNLFKYIKFNLIK